MPVQSPFDGLSEAANPTVKPAKPRKVEPPEGIHMVKLEVDSDGNPTELSYYKVQRAVHGSGRLYAKVFTNGDWEYLGRGAAFWSLSKDTLLSLDEAKEFGWLYGRCGKCGATLTRESSIEAGIGPVCAASF